MIVKVTEAKIYIFYEMNMRLFHICVFVMLDFLPISFINRKEGHVHYETKYTFQCRINF